MQIQFRLRTLFVTVAIAAAVLFAVDTVSVVVWDGQFPLQVYLRGTHNRKIIEVAAEPLTQIEYADYVNTAPGKLDLRPDRVDWVEGQPFTVRVPCSGRTSKFGRELSYRQFELLVLRISFTDGDVELISVEIPDGRKAREVSVTVPERKPAA